MRPLFCLLPFLMNAATDPASGGEGGKTSAAPPDAPDAAAALAALEDKTLPMSQRLDVAFKALKGIDPTNQLAGVKKQLSDAQASIVQKDAEIEKIKGELSAAQKQIEAREADVKTIEAANVKLETEAKELRAKEQDLTKRADAKAKEKVAALGFPAAKLPAASDAISAETEEEQIAALNKKIEATTDPVEKGRLAQQVWDIATHKQSKN